MNGVFRQKQDLLKRRHDEEGSSFFPRREEVMPGEFLGFPGIDEGAGASSIIVPPVTVVFEGRSICHRIHLHSLHSYESFALALRRMFVDRDAVPAGAVALSNAIPGHIVAYEDIEDDLLLAGDLKWKDFVRVAKRIRILPAKASRWRICGDWGPSKDEIEEELLLGPAHLPDS